MSEYTKHTRLDGSYFYSQEIETGHSGSSLPPARGSATSIETISVFKGETWLAYRPGEDATFKDAWVSRTERGVMCSVVNSKKNLIANAKLCKVRLKWPNI